MQTTPSSELQRRCELTRRNILQGVVGLTGLSTAARAETAFQPTEINHVTLNVKDLKRSEEFYAKLFGPPQWRMFPDTDPMRLVGFQFQFGSSMLVLEAYSERRIGVDHPCLSVEGYTIPSSVALLKQVGTEAEFPYGAEQVYFRDLNGILIQLDRPEYRNSAWRRADAPRLPSQPVFKPMWLDHITLQVSNLEATAAFYERLFGPVERQPQASPPGGGVRMKSRQWFWWGTAPDEPIGVSHFAIAIEGYEPDAVAEKLRQAGIASHRRYQPNQVFVRDPDGILVQLASAGSAQSNPTNR